MKNAILASVKHCMYAVNYENDSTSFNYDDGIKLAMDSLINAKTYLKKEEIIGCLYHLLNSREAFEKRFKKNPSVYDQIEIEKVEFEKENILNTNKMYIITDALGDKNAIHIFSNEFEDKVLLPLICTKKKIKISDEAKLMLVKSGSKNLILDEEEHLIAEVIVNEYKEVFLKSNKLVIDCYNNQTSNLLEFYPKPYLDSLYKHAIPNEKQLVGKCLINELDYPKSSSIAILDNFSKWLDPEFMILIAIAAIRS